VGQFMHIDIGRTATAKEKKVTHTNTRHGIWRLFQLFVSLAARAAPYRVRKQGGSARVRHASAFSFLLPLLLRATSNECQ